MGTSENPKIMRMKSFRVFPKWILKVSSPKRSRGILRNFRATRFLKIAVKMAAQTPNPYFLGFPRNFYRKSKFFRNTGSFWTRIRVRITKAESPRPHRQAGAARGRLFHLCLLVMTGSIWCSKTFLKGSKKPYFP